MIIVVKMTPDRIKSLTTFCEVQWNTDPMMLYGMLHIYLLGGTIEEYRIVLSVLNRLDKDGFQERQVNACKMACIWREIDFLKEVLSYGILDVSCLDNFVKTEEQKILLRGISSSS
jgi:hypothetical protein